MPKLRHTWAVAAVFVLAACSPAAEQTAPSIGSDVTSTTLVEEVADSTTTTSVVTTTTTTRETTTTAPPPTLGTFIGSALPGDPPPTTPRPVRLSIEAVDVVDAPVIDVGVLPDGDMEIPGAREVGWYRFGPSPGEEGSAVLAAHIAFNGVDGVFRRLDRLQPGALVEVWFEDETVKTFEVLRLEQYEKSRLPVDDLFSETGEPRLTLITCGGDFNRSLRSYTDNVVAVAKPVSG